MKSLQEYIFESGEVKNAKLRKLLNDHDYSDIELIKGKGYFYVISSDPDSEHERWLQSTDTDIYLNSFNMQSPEEWYRDIIEILERGKKEYE